MSLEPLGSDVPPHRRGPVEDPPDGTSDDDGTTPAGAPDRLRFAVLGPVRVWRGQEPLDAGRPRERSLLCALLLRRGRTATAAELVDALWGGDAPPHAVPGLRTYAFRLRKTLGARTLVSDAGGYALPIQPGDLDLAVCEKLETRAKRARAVGDLPRARELLTRALALWDGEPLGGVPGPFAEAQRARLAEWRLELLECRLEWDLELGLHAEAVCELTALSAEQPLRERLRGLLMLALYRGGRQAEALGVYADTRRLLSEELGVDPGPELADLHQRILRADPGLAAPGRHPAHGGPLEARPLPRPAQLPAGVADFTGRADLVDRLTAHLLRAGSEVTTVSAVRGLGGVGKTTLAVHVAHAAAAHFPDGQLYADLLGQGPSPADPSVVLGAFLRALGTAASALPETVEERAALYRSSLAGRRVLVLLDNARDAAQVRPLLPGAPGCAVLVTSRAKMADLPGTHLVDLDVMSPEEALDLFTRVVGEERVRSERPACLDVVGSCGFLPLAIRIAASRLVTRPSWTVSALAVRLVDERRRLDELRSGHLTVDASFALGYGHLEADQARAFRLLALLDGPDASLAAAAAVLDRCEDDAEELLESLVDASLLESTAPGRYRYHDLLRLYARRRCVQEDPAGERTAALSRLLDFYLATAAGIYALENPGDRLLEHLTATRRPGRSFTHMRPALDWLFNEGPCVLATVEQAAAEPALLGRAADVLFMAQDLMESGAYVRQYGAATRAVTDAAHEHGDARSEGRARVLLGRVHHMADHMGEALAEAARALALGRATGDPVIRGYALNLHGLLAIVRARYEDAAAYFTDALGTFRADGNRYGETTMLMNVGRAQLHLGQVGDAIAASEQAVRSWRELGASLRLANGHYALGLALHEAGRHREALDRFHQARAMFEDGRQPYWVGMALFRIARTELAARLPHEAAAHAENALVLLREVAGDWRCGNVLAVLGQALHELGQAARARSCWTQALTILDRLGAPEADEVRALLSGKGS
jgi:DNA-binding SARP family transcriptional activator